MKRNLKIKMILPALTEAESPFWRPIKYTLAFMNRSKLFTHPMGWLAILSGFCLLATTYRSISQSSLVYLFLNWNLFLAWIPLLIAKHWARRPIAHANKMICALLFFGWLLFFPNAPYLITDLKHLNNRLPHEWIDPLILFSFALTGFILGLYSLKVIHRQLKKVVSITNSWFIIISSMILSGFGIYLGRVQRWNSWDLATKPMTLLLDAMHQVTNPLAIQMTIAYSSLMLLAYLLVHHSLSYAQNHK
ncbi:MAG: DUF1361 domain-containing protein [Reichenbachiella sp.]|uniref:DUF1361 domain-containing protein n=1 Tax=Reichenbachiella sp. TaxID=2184521 RepID=UPI003264A1CA